MKVVVIILHLLGQNCPHWDDASTKELIYEGCIHLNQKFIHKKISEMSDTVRTDVDSEGGMIYY